MGWLENENKRQTATVARLGLRVGDYMRRGGYDVWREVTDVWDTACSVAGRGGHGGYTFLSDVDYIHRKDDPWDHGEVRYVIDTTGHYGGKREPAVPAQYRYHGTYRAEIWGHKWAGYITTPKVAVASLEAFAEKAGVQVAGIPWDAWWAVQEALEGVVVNRWRIVVKPVPEVQYGRTIVVRDYICRKGGVG